MHTCQFSYLSRNETAPLRFDPVASWFLTQCCRAPLLGLTQWRRRSVLTQCCRAPLLGLTQWRRRSVLTQCCRAPAPAIHLEPFLGTNPSRRQTSAAAIFLRQIRPFPSSNATFLVIECSLSRCPSPPLVVKYNLPQQPALLFCIFQETILWL